MASPFPKLLHNMEYWNGVQGKKGTFILWFLILSSIFLLSSLYSSNPFVGLISTDPRHNHSATAIISLNESLTLTTKEIPSDSPPPKSSPVVDEVCDYSSGKWIRETRGSIYTNWSCPTLPETRDCVRYGKDPAYINWRWKPDQCELPFFDAKLFLRIVQGKTFAFVGDSLARNQINSLLCLLSQVEVPENTYKVDNDKSQAWYFPSHDFTLRVIWSEFLVLGIERVINGTPSNTYDVHLDKGHPEWTEILPKLKYLVISSGNWFLSRKTYLYKDGNLIGCAQCNEGNLTTLGIKFSVKSVFRTALEIISKCENCEGMLTVLRTFTQSHYEGGAWFTGGYCNKTHPLDESEISLGGDRGEIKKIQVEEMERVTKKKGRTKNRFALIDITKAMMMRADAHPGSNWSKKWSKNVNDCLHWCLPGPIDMWNDVLLEIIRKDSLV